MKMVVALLALASAGIFGTHILDALRADHHHGVDFQPLHPAGKIREELPVSPKSGNATVLR